MPSHVAASKDFAPRSGHGGLLDTPAAAPYHAGASDGTGTIAAEKTSQ